MQWPAIHMKNFCEPFLLFNVVGSPPVLVFRRLINSPQRPNFRHMLHFPGKSEKDTNKKIKKWKRKRVSMSMLQFWGEASIPWGKTEDMIYPSFKLTWRMNGVFCFLISFINQFMWLPILYVITWLMLSINKVLTTFSVENIGFFLL